MHIYTGITELFNDPYVTEYLHCGTKFRFAKTSYHQEVHDSQLKDIEDYVDK